MLGSSPYPETIDWTERLAVDRDSSLWQTFVNYRRKKIYNISPCSGETHHRVNSSTDEARFYHKPPTIWLLDSFRSVCGAKSGSGTSATAGKTTHTIPSIVMSGKIVRKIFFNSPTMGRNKLECLPPGKIFKPSYILARSARSRPKRAVAFSITTLSIMGLIETFSTVVCWV